MSVRKTVMPRRKRRNTSLLVLLVASLWVLVQGGGAAATEKKFVAEGGAVVLSCDLSYDPTKALVWLERVYGGIVRRLPNSPPNDLQVFNPSFTNRVSLVETDGVDLRIENIGEEDEGSYYCQQEGTDSDGTLQQLIVASPPDPPAPTITGYSGGFITPGSRLTLTCVSTGGNPPSVLTWWKDGAQLTASSSHTTGQGDTVSVLNIPALQPSDNGEVYQCRVTQPALTQVETSQVTVSVAFLEDTPTVTGYPAGTAVDSGSDLTLTCTSGNSNPAATITWSRDGGSAFTGTNNREQAGSHGGRVTSQDLVISLQPQHNGAQYTCTATNAELGLDRESSALGPLNVRYTSGLHLSREEVIIICTCVGAAVIILVVIIIIIAVYCSRKGEGGSPSISNCCTCDTVNYAPASQDSSEDTSNQAARKQTHPSVKKDTATEDSPDVMAPAPDAPPPDQPNGCTTSYPLSGEAARTGHTEKQGRVLSLDLAKGRTGAGRQRAQTRMPVQCHEDTGNSNSSEGYEKETNV